MTDQRAERRDARYCPDCDVRGILPLDQPREPGGGFKHPIYICPNCGIEFIAEGWQAGFVKPPPDWDDLTEEEQEEAALKMARSLQRQWGEEPDS